MGAARPRVSSLTLPGPAAWGAPAKLPASTGQVAHQEYNSARLRRSARRCPAERESNKEIFMMKDKAILTITSLLSILFMTLHFTQDTLHARVGSPEAGGSTLVAVPILVIWLYGTLM